MRYDLIIITAANKAQANGYLAQLKGRKGFMVLPDPGDKRVGSLGATVNALRRLRNLSPKSKVLICHSGGDARRTPAYAALGKAFVPMTDSRPLLDHVIEAMEKLPAKPGVNICCGDVIPRLDYSLVRFADKGVTGVAYPDGPWQANRHGVYVAECNDGAAPAIVTDFLQKPQVKRGKFLIDTGIMHIDWATASKMCSLPVTGDIYEEFPAMLLKGYAPFSVSVVDKCEFFHIGSSRELLALLGKDNKLIDSCAAPIKSLGGDNIVVNVPADYGEVALSKGECLTCLPLGKDEWYSLKYNVDDNFKTDGLWDKHGLGEKMKVINHKRLAKLRRREVRVTAPVRIDFAGGWSDTPPICNAEGGAVLAAAVRLDGRRPIEVTVRERSDKFIKVVSKDLGMRRIIKSADEIADHHDPHDWCALVKSALAVTGFKFGSRGLDIVISADLPKGSGMGTSSILGAATIAALLGRVDVDEIGELTLRLEQEMHTGGGWEDQFAGLTGGIKLMTSKPGETQRIKIEQLPLGDDGFAKVLKERSLLYFTGQKRMARNVLRRVLRFYAENPHDFGRILIKALKKGAADAAEDVKRGDIESFAQRVNEYWRDKKLLDSGSTNERVEEIIERIKPWVSAVSLAGAGGGGFMYILAKSKSDAKKIRAALNKNPPSRYSRFYDFEIDNQGLCLSAICK